MNTSLVKVPKILSYCKKIMSNMGRESLFVTAFFIIKKILDQPKVVNRGEDK